MRRWILPALMITLLLCGCGQSGPERKLDGMQKELAAARDLAVSAHVTAFLGDERFVCDLRCVSDAEQSRVEITAPETIAGISAVVGPEGMTIAYEEMSLGVGGYAPDAAPVSALPLLLTALRSGSALRNWTEWEDERTLFVREYYVTEEVGLTVWFDAGTLQPVHAEFARDGATVLRCEITEFSYT